MNTPGPKIKICGLKDPQNIREIGALAPDFMGFVFYPSSPRFAGDLDPAILHQLPPGIGKTGVFVNESASLVTTVASTYHLDVVQLHGEETPAQCAACKQHGLRVIKAIPVRDRIDHAYINQYRLSVDFILFDTATTKKGGSGIRFDWTLLQEYHGHIPFFLSGGIAPNILSELSKIQEHPFLHALDINSRFEVSPGIKDVAAVRKFIYKMKNDESISR